MLCGDDVVEETHDFNLMHRLPIHYLILLIVTVSWDLNKNLIEFLNALKVLIPLNNSNLSRSVSCGVQQSELIKGVDNLCGVQPMWVLVSAS